MKIRLPRSGPRPIPISIQTTGGFRYQQQLDEQMKIQELERERIFQQFLKEKEMIDEVLINPFINAALLVCKVVRKIQRENEAATLTKLLQKKATKEQVI